MSVESPFISTHHPSRLAEKSEKELFRDVIEAEYNGVKLDMVPYLDAFIRVGGFTLKTEKGDLPDPNKLLIIAVNHHSRQRFFTTKESLRVVGIATVSTRNEGISEKDIAWMVRHLPIPLVGIGKMARQVQNATGPVFDSIPARTVKKLSIKGFVPRYRETMTNEDTISLIKRVTHRVQNNFALGVLPEQEPSFELKPYHRNFARTLDNLKLLSSDYQIATIASFYERNLAFAVYGPVIGIQKETDIHEAATKVMKGIAQGLPRKLKGHYA